MTSITLTAGHGRRGRAGLRQQPLQVLVAEELCRIDHPGTRHRQPRRLGGIRSHGFADLEDQRRHRLESGGAQILAVSADDRSLRVRS